MIKANRIVLLVVAFAAIACNQSKTDSILKINVSDKNITGDFSTLVESYEVIDLDNQPEAYFRFTSKIIIADSVWLFCNPNDSKVLAFSSKGKFLNSIGRKGRGPGELGYINDFAYNPGDKTITVYERSKAKRFSLAGSFLGELDLGFSPTKVVNLNNSQMLFEKHIASGDSTTDFELRLVDKDLQTLDKRLPQKPVRYIGSSLYGQLSRAHTNNDYAYHFSLAGDTIFHIRQGQITPAYFLAYDKEIVIQKIITEANAGINEAEQGNIYKQLCYYETGDLCLLVFQNNDETYCLVFNSKSRETRVYKNAFYPDLIQGDEAILVTNSLDLKKFVDKTIDPDGNKCSNRDTRDSLIAKSMEDFQVILKIKLRLEQQSGVKWRQVPTQ